MSRMKEIRTTNDTKVKRSIRTTILIAFFTVLIATLAIISTGAFVKFKGIMEANEEKSIAMLNVEIDNAVNAYLKHYVQTLDALAYVSESTDILTNPAAESQLLNKFDQFIKTDKDIQFIYMGTEDGRMIMRPADDLGPGYDPRKRDWYNQAKGVKETILTDPYFDDTSNKMVVTACRAVFDKTGKLVGVLGIDLSLEAINNETSKLKIGEKGYPIIVDKNNVIISHADTAKLGKPLETKVIVEALADPKKEIIYYNYTVDKKTQKKLAVIHQMRNTNWRIVSTYYVDEIDREVMGFISFIIFCGIAALLLSTFIILMVTRGFNKNIHKLSSTMQVARTGDLSVRSHIVSKDETGLLSQFFDETIADLSALVANVQEVSAELTEAAQNLAATSEEVSASADEVAKTVEDIARGAEDQASDAEASAGSSRDLSTSFGELQNMTEEMLKAADALNRANQTSYSAIQELTTTNEQSNEANRLISTSVNELSHKTSEISSILDAISAISVQTNLLALNASIEAARAGEHGRGFAVVAEEIRKLAEASAASADEVRIILGNIQTDSQVTVSHMSKLNENTAAQNHSVQSVYEAFNTIDSAYSQISGKIQSISAAVDHIKVKQDAMLGNIENISAVSQQTAAASEEVTASMDQQVYAVEEVAKSAQQLNEISAHLSQKISHFKINR